MQIKVTNLSFQYPTSAKEVFSNTSFVIDTAWSLGFTGRNGRGKSTFMKLLAGDLEPTAGNIQSGQALKFKYFPYSLNLNLSALEAWEVLVNVGSKPEGYEKAGSFTENYTPESHVGQELWKFERELNWLEVAEDARERPLSTLSPGELTKVQLALLFLDEMNYVLIDEPTNHLDLPTREVLAKYLKRKSGFILVSHDRWLLDEVTDHTLSINKANIEVIAGPYSVYEQQKGIRDEFERAEDERLRRQVKALGESAGRTANWAGAAEASKARIAGQTDNRKDTGFLGKKAAKIAKRAKLIERRAAEALESKQKLLQNVEEREELNFAQLEMSEELRKRVAQVLEQYATRLDRHEEEAKQSAKTLMRLQIFGKNGAGKTTLLRKVTNELRQIEGLKVAVLRQTNADLPQEMQYLSEGQKRRYLLELAITTPAHIYILDEPLNYLDVIYRQAFEQAVLRDQPNLVFVEHDAAFSRRVALAEVEVIDE